MTRTYTLTRDDAPAGTIIVAIPARGRVRLVAANLAASTQSFAFTLVAAARGHHPRPSSWPGAIPRVPRAVAPAIAELDWQSEAVESLLYALSASARADHATRAEMHQPSPTTTPATRLAAIRAARAARAATRAAQAAGALETAFREQALARSSGYRRASGRWAGGRHSDEVIIADMPAAQGGSDRAWSANGKWSGLNSWRNYMIRRDWVARVANRGCAIVRDGLNRWVVLDCDEVRGPLYHVLVVLPSRGFDVRTEWRWAEAVPFVAAATNAVLA